MRIVRDLDTLDASLRGAAYAIGNFDGVHRGHQAVIARTADHARELGAPLGVLTFEPHPRRFFQPDLAPFSLTPFEAKMALLEQLKLDLVVALPFDAGLAGLSAEDFITKILVGRLRCGHITAGHDFHFGRKRTGTPAALADWGAKLKFGVEILPPVGEAGQVFSSSRIRDALTNGRPKDAAEMMGHWWTITGDVIHGDERGRKIGFPTANLALSEHLVPALGVYAVRVTIGSTTRFGVANLGRRPTFGENAVLLEVHVFDFEGDLYGKHAKVALVDFIRPERKFDGLDALKRQIAADAETARAILKDPQSAETRFALRIP